MRNRILSYSRMLLFFVFLLGWNSAWPDASYDRGLLWAVTAPGGEKSYVLGTIHSGEPSVLELRPPVEKAFSESRHYVMEFIPDAAAMKQLQASMLYPSGEQLADALPDSLYRQVVEAMAERGVPEASTTRMRPWVLLMILNMPVNTSGQILDNQLYQRALAEGKQITGLETAEEQLDVLSDWPQDKINAWLADTVVHLDELEAMQGALLGAWLDRDLKRLQEISNSMEFGDEADNAAFTKRLVDERNVRMVERMVPSLKEGDAFVAIGALHLPGEQGVLNLLRKRGYRLEVLY
jgi:uncharacterized protein